MYSIYEYVLIDHIVLIFINDYCENPNSRGTYFNR